MLDLHVPYGVELYKMSSSTIPILFNLSRCTIIRDAARRTNCGPHQELRSGLQWVLYFRDLQRTRRVVGLLRSRAQSMRTFTYLSPRSTLQFIRVSCIQQHNTRGVRRPIIAVRRRQGLGNRSMYIRSRGTPYLIGIRLCPKNY